MESRTQAVNGIRMRWEERGEGLPVVFIHGIPTSPALWRNVLPRIDNARCLAFEMVGYGQSIHEGDNRDISIRRQADYLLDWLNSLGIEKAVYVGHDLGGGVAQIAAVKAPERCAGLFLTNAICYDSWPIPSVKAMRAAGPLTSHLPNAMGKQVLRTLMWRGHDDKRAAHEALELHWKPYASDGGAGSLLRQMQALHTEDTLQVAGDLPTLQRPARIVWGAADPFQKIEYGEHLARDLQAPLLRIEGGKHFTPEDHPDIIAAEIKKLLETIH